VQEESPGWRKDPIARLRNSEAACAAAKNAKKAKEKKSVRRRVKSCVPAAHFIKMFF
jgi:hypothetical protein